MVEAPGIALAFAAGFVSFVSPCCLPLVPGYLAVVCGTEPGEGRGRLDRRVLARSLLFVASFSTVFILLGLTATAIGALLFDNQPTLNKVAGAAIIAMGALFVASVFIVRLNSEWRPQALVERAGNGGPVVVGLAFAVAWTPCVGPTLAAILGLAAIGQSTAQSAALLAVYSAGLAVPFLFSALAFNAAQRSFDFFRRHYAPIQVGAGLVLVAMGVLVISGELFRLNIEVRQALDGLGLDFFQYL
ncbi:MAG: cytochrome c biogenesis CcdA family protein [Candidatus Limnocylindria bacterium]